MFSSLKVNFKSQFHAGDFAFQLCKTGMEPCIYGLTVARVQSQILFYQILPKIYVQRAFLNYLGR